MNSTSSTSGYASRTRSAWAEVAPSWAMMRIEQFRTRTVTARRRAEAVQRERVQVAEAAVDDHEHVLRRLDEVDVAVLVDPAVLGRRGAGATPATTRRAAWRARRAGAARRRCRDTCAAMSSAQGGAIATMISAPWCAPMNALVPDERERLADDLEQVGAVVGDDVGDVDRAGRAVHGDGVRAGERCRGVRRAAPTATAPPTPRRRCRLTRPG